MPYGEEPEGLDFKPLPTFRSKGRIVSVSKRPDLVLEDDDAYVSPGPKRTNHYVARTVEAEGTLQERINTLEREGKALQWLLSSLAAHYSRHTKHRCEIITDCEYVINGGSPLDLNWFENDDPPAIQE
jgi:hypothetical protein